ncbi:AraC family transcriptional regulator of adaptative response / methylphosphotriester-DNA alkyltransferase methyltransferase [Paenibacillus harenae]|uniref:AraC family transcriptional regulator of adaptative response / methylphosphotriester-DNA alkyltransferase methyltransferase n=2 Tax=Paenibacillus harenae TaxID=306543 RepID=A0ABT9U2J8_PAEHA|nr:AraC family transcriptional regulator of adaptative response / methylphosphotriester-DNA alkyltransferase methyltransferase [Paenibacillus harenae]
MRARNEEHDDGVDQAVSMVQERLTEEKWQAILHNDADYDGKFWYAVKTTSIFCRPSCKSKPPKKENVRIYPTAEQALTGGFRPCKRCKPTGEKLPDEEWIGHVTDYIVSHYKEHLTLELLADTSHSSPYHLQRTFKRISGITPTEYIQDLRIQHAKTLLVRSDRKIAEIGSQVGMTNTPYFVTLFKQKVGCTPASYRRQHKRGD